MYTSTHDRRACVLLYDIHSFATLLHLCTGCLVVTIQAKILSLLPLPMTLLSLSPVQPPPPPICQTDARAGGFPSPPAQYSKQLNMRHGLTSPTSRVCSCLFRSLCMHLLRLCQSEPFCARPALHCTDWLPLGQSRN